MKIFKTKNRSAGITAFTLVGILVGLTSPLYASPIVFTGTGTSSSGDTVSFQADMNISGNTLTILLANTSPQATDDPSELLSSFFFDISNSNGIAPTLTFESATGEVHAFTYDNSTHTATDTGGSVLEIGQNSNASSLIGGWQFSNFTPDGILPYNFGIGTVGNSTNTSFDQNYTFNGSDVQDANYSIYTGTVTTKNLTNMSPLVNGSALFTFTISSGFTNADIHSVLVGLGTGPDSTIPSSEVPEPATMLLFGTGLLGLTGFLKRKSSQKPRKLAGVTR